MAQTTMAEGLIYIMINPAMPGLLKIGKTGGTSEDRAAELSSVTGLPTAFVVAGEWRTCDCDAAETEVHARLSSSRYSENREFFRLPLKDAIDVVSEVCRHFGIQPTNQQASRRNQAFGRIFTAAVLCQRCRQKYSVTLSYLEKEVVCPNCQNRQSHSVEWL